MRTITRYVLMASVLISSLSLSGCFVRGDGGRYRGNGYGYGNQGNGRGYGHGRGR